MVNPVVSEAHTSLHVFGQAADPGAQLEIFGEARCRSG